MERTYLDIKSGHEKWNHYFAPGGYGDPSRKTDIIYDLDIKDHLSANMQSAVDCFIFTYEENK